MPNTPPLQESAICFLCFVALVSVRRYNPSLHHTSSLSVSSTCPFSLNNTSCHNRSTLLFTLISFRSSILDFNSIFFDFWLPLFANSDRIPSHNRPHMYKDPFEFPAALQRNCTFCIILENSLCQRELLCSLSPSPYSINFTEVFYVAYIVGQKIGKKHWQKYYVVTFSTSNIR